MKELPEIFLKRMDENIIADCGLISVFVCFNCCRTQSVIVSS